MLQDRDVEKVEKMIAALDHLDIAYTILLPDPEAARTEMFFDGSLRVKSSGRDSFYTALGEGKLLSETAGSESTWRDKVSASKAVENPRQPGG